MLMAVSPRHSTLHCLHSVRYWCWYWC